jgi:hypothetical protein
MPVLAISDLVNANAAAAGIDPRTAAEALFPIYTHRGRLGNYQVKLNGASVSGLAAAITQAETGGNIVGNNPGNLELGDIGYGTRTAAGGQQLTIFPTLAAGQQALENQIQSIISGSSLYPAGASIAQVADIYVTGQAGSGGGAAWANNVANYLGVSPNDSFAAQAGLDGGTLTAPDTSDVEIATDQPALPAWLPWAAAGAAAYLLFF